MIFIARRSILAKAIDIYSEQTDDRNVVFGRTKINKILYCHIIINITEENCDDRITRCTYVRYIGRYRILNIIVYVCIHRVTAVYRCISNTVVGLCETQATALGTIFVLIKLS